MPEYGFFPLGEGGLRLIRRTIGLGAVLFWLLWPVGGGAQPGVRVARVFDGDTVRLTNGQRVRLAGIDAPEIAHGGVPGQYYAVAATRELVRLTQGKTLRFEPVGPGHDRYGRALGDLFLPDGTSVAEGMLEAGTAFFLWNRDLPEPLVRRLLASQRRAMEAERGFWPHLLRLSPPSGGYVGNAASRRFHMPGCPKAARISRRNRVRLADIRQAFAQGFAPARECTPWPPAGPGREAFSGDMP